MTRRAHDRDDAGADGVADALVLFGATGDLTARKIFPALYSMTKRRNLPLRRIVGVASSPWDLEQFRERARWSIEEHGGGIDDPAAFEYLQSLLGYVSGMYDDPATFTQLRKVLGDARRPLHYLAVPPSLFETVIERLGSSGAAHDARVIVEKPFGRDLRSARELNAVLHSVFPEDRAFRIDHYLGKEAVQNLLYFRFANSFLEPIWNRNYVRLVQVTMAESLGVEGRGRFYEEVGTLRDVVQNHLLQIVALLAMEPPVGARVDQLRDSKERVFGGMRPLTRADLVRGQYAGYREEPGVAPDSDVETFAAVRLSIDSWRWADVPFYVRAGKNLPCACTEVRVELHRPPQRVFAEFEDLPRDTNYVRFQLSPRVVIAIGARAKAAGESFSGAPVELDLCNDHPDAMSPYERLLDDAMEGEKLLFAREDGVEAAWAVIDGVLTDHDVAHPYDVHTWGPKEADALVDDPHGWHDPIP